MTAAPKFPLALLADDELFAIVRNHSELEAACDVVARPYVKVTTRPPTDLELARCWMDREIEDDEEAMDREIEDDEEAFERRYAGEHPDDDYAGRPW